ncbi:MAG: YbaB/EbfC family nucleoid-associated protein, partial [Bacteroidota bacterium]
LLGLEIDPALSDQLIIRDLVIAAVNKAQEEADVQAKELMRKSTEGIIPNIPGMDLGSMMG